MACGYALKLEARLATAQPIDAIGARYFMVFEGERMWRFPNNLQHVPARLGVPSERLDQPLPKGGPNELLKYARVATELARHAHCRGLV